MFGIGIGELCIVLIVALAVFGPKQLPTAAKQLGLFIHTLKQNAQVLQKDLFGEGEMLPKTAPREDRKVD